MKLKFIEIPEISSDLGLKQAADGILVFNSEHEKIRQLIVSIKEVIDMRKNKDGIFHYLEHQRGSDRH